MVNHVAVIPFGNTAVRMVIRIVIFIPFAGQMAGKRRGGQGMCPVVRDLRIAQRFGFVPFPAAVFKIQISCQNIPGRRMRLDDLQMLDLLDQIGAGLRTRALDIHCHDFQADFHAVRIFEDSVIRTGTGQRECPRRAVVCKQRRRGILRVHTGKRKRYIRHSGEALITARRAGRQQNVSRSRQRQTGGRKRQRLRAVGIGHNGLQIDTFRLICCINTCSVRTGNIDIGQLVG